MFEDFTREKQLELTSRWRDPLVYDVVGTVLFRRPRWQIGENNVKNILDTEFLVTKRLRGACQGHLQSHHGGFMKVTDDDARAAAIREVREETGIALAKSDIDFIAFFGPKLYRSTMSLVQSGWPNIALTITDTPAEPTAPFELKLFVAEVYGDGQPVGPTDGEVGERRWLILREIIEQYGQSPQFNYFSMLFQAIRYIYWPICESDDHFPSAEPGTYLLY